VVALPWRDSPGMMIIPSRPLAGRIDAERYP
jgi:hypothetical protein